MGPSNLSIETYKEANRMMWMVKGRLIPLEWDDEAILATLNSYTKRLWHNEEAGQYVEGFEEAWKHRMLILFWHENI